MNLDRIINSEEFNLIQYNTLRSLLGKYKIHLEKSHSLYSGIQTSLHNWKLIEHQIQSFETNKLVGVENNFKTYNKINNLHFYTDT